MIVTNKFTPWFGLIEDVNDTKKGGRYRVRIYGYNTANKGILPTENLRWFNTIVSNSAAIGGIGESPTGLLVGTMVFGYFIDEDLQEGMIVGSICGINDISDIAKGGNNSYVQALKSGVVKNIPDARGETWSEPETSYATQYPKNKVFQSESGHVVEYDDTPGAERVTIFHKSGTFEEIHPDGKRVEHNTAESFSINLAGHNLFVNGNLNMVATGDFRISAGGEVYIKSSHIVFDTPKTETYGISNAIDHFSSNVSGAYHVHPGVQTGNGVSPPPLGAINTLFPTPANKFFISAEDTGFTPDKLKYAVENGFLTQEEADAISSATYTIDSKDTSQTEQKRPKISECGIEITDTVDYNIQLSDNYQLRDVSIGAAVSQYTIVDQAGLMKNEIICNLKNLVLNVLEPILAMYSNVIVTSGFRHGDGSSQHDKGESIDIQFTNASNSFYYDAALWIKNNVPYDQLILEYQSTNGGTPWIHISLKNERSQRYEILTQFNHETVQTGLLKLT